MIDSRSDTQFDRADLCGNSLVQRVEQHLLRQLGSPRRTQCRDQARLGKTGQGRLGKNNYPGHRYDLASSTAGTPRQYNQRNRHISNIVFHTPCVSQRRPEVTTRSIRQIGLDSANSRLDNSISSISGCSGKPPTDSKARRVTNMAWSPVAIPVRRERQFIRPATTRSMNGRPLMRTSKRPHAYSCVRPLRRTAASIACSAPKGNRVSACKNSRTSPCAPAAPAFICRALPRSAQITCAPAREAICCEPSSLPPSTTITLLPHARRSEERRGG